MKFRMAELDDLEILNQISIKSKSFWGYPESWIDNWRSDLMINQEKLLAQNILVAEVENKIIGFSSIIENSDHYEILHLWILPEYIGKGFGKKLLDKIIELFVKSDKSIKVVADPNAESFYERQGFITFDKVESSPRGRFLPIMKKEN